jgi:hypothetical protein
MTNLDSQTTADFWDAYITAAEADTHVPVAAPTSAQTTLRST